MLSAPLSPLGSAPIHRRRWAMLQTRAALDPHGAERWCWLAARRDDARVARRLSRQPVGAGVYEWEAGAWGEDWFAVVPPLGGGAWRGAVQGTAVPRARVPVVPSVRLDRRKTWFGLESRRARPAWLWRDEARRRLGGQGPPGPVGGVPTGPAHRQGPRTTEPIGPEALADNRVKVNGRDLEDGCHSVIRARAQAGGVAAQVTGRVEATALETTAQDAGWGQVTRQRQLTATRGQVHESAVTVEGWKRMGVIEARTTIPLAATGVPSGAGNALPARLDHAGAPPAGRPWPPPHSGRRYRGLAWGRVVGAGAARQHRCGAGQGQEGGDLRRPGPSRCRRRDHRGTSGTDRPPWPGSNGLECASGDRSRRAYRADDR
jgi:hypothetical protein